MLSYNCFSGGVYLVYPYCASKMGKSCCKSCHTTKKDDLCQNQLVLFHLFVKFVIFDVLSKGSAYATGQQVRTDEFCCCCHFRARQKLLQRVLICPRPGQEISSPFRSLTWVRVGSYQICNLDLISAKR